MNYYELLQVSQNASSEIIDKAYKTLVSKYHPDKVEGQYRSQAEEYMKQLNEARAVLLDNDLREEYNRLLIEYNRPKEKIEVSSDYVSKLDSLPNWLRWVLSLPLSVAAYFLIRIVTNLSLNWYFGLNSEAINLLLDATVGVGTLILTFYTIVPTHKFKALVTISFIVSMFFIAIGYMLIDARLYLEDSLLFTFILYLLPTIVSIISCRSVYKDINKNNL